MYGLTLELKGFKLANRDLFSKSDPYFVISKQSLAGGWNPLRTSETIKVWSFSLSNFDISGQYYNGEDDFSMAGHPSTFHLDFICTHFDSVWTIFSGSFWDFYHIDLIIYSLALCQSRMGSNISYQFLIFPYLKGLCRCQRKIPFSPILYTENIQGVFFTGTPLKSSKYKKS